MKGATRRRDLDFLEGEGISIHAPVKGATRPRRGETVDYPISIHAPVKGATYGEVVCRDDASISIHAPVKGATDVAVLLASLEEFQSTHP